MVGWFFAGFWFGFLVGVLAVVVELARIVPRREDRRAGGPE